MKIIQSFWSGNQTDFNNSYGWHSNKYNWMSWILSCNQLVKYHKEVELYTDNFGYEILIKKLKLPYTKVHVVLDELNHYHKDLWAIAKVRTFQLQTEPFLHVDGDVFVWESLADRFRNSNLVTQNLEITTDYYGAMWNDIYPNLSFLPQEMRSYNNKTSNLACNMGIIGGNDINFFKEYTRKSIEFVDNNTDSWSKVNGFNFNVFFEQVLFHELAKEKNKKIDFLFDEVSTDNSYVGFGDFHKVPTKTYLHLLGVYKRNLSICRAMEIYTMKYYPESYSKLTRSINEKNGNTDEIDFLSSKAVDELLMNFSNELKNNKIDGGNFLLKRDLFNEGLPRQLEEFIDKKQNFWIILLSGFETKCGFENNEQINYLKIEEINCINNTYELDEIDIIMQNELSNPVQYLTFINRITEYFDEQDEESQSEFLDLINSRLADYIILKIISIYN